MNEQGQEFAAAGGVQPHSVGGLYPYIIFARQASSDTPLIWGVQDPDGTELMVGGYDAAVKWAEHWKKADLTGAPKRRDVDDLLRWLLGLHNATPFMPHVVSDHARYAMRDGDEVTLLAWTRFARLTHFILW